jgi:hypothetical protein
MICENKNYLLDLFYLEGDEHKHSEIREHVKNCENCREYLGTLKKTMNVLNKLEDESPSPKILDNIITEISTSVPKPLVQKTGVQIMPILQIAFGQIFLFGIIYFLKINISLMPAWKFIRESWIVQLLGSSGAAVIFVLFAGTFITLSLAPILLIESNKNKKFS